jgi:hypothetical protein
LVYCMTHKPSKSQQKTPIISTPKKGTTRSPKCKKAHFLPAFTALYITNLTRTKCQLTLPHWHLTASWRNVHWKPPEKRNSGAGFSTMTTYPHTLLWLCVHFSVKTKQKAPSFHTSLLTRFSALCLLSFPKGWGGIKGEENHLPFKATSPQFEQSHRIHSGTVTGLTVWSPTVSTLKGRHLLKCRCCYGEISQSRNHFIALPCA